MNVSSTYVPRLLPIGLALLLAAAASAEDIRGTPSGTTSEVSGVRFRDPVITLNFPFGRMAVDTDEVFLSGRVSAATDVSLFTINGRKVPAEGKEFSWGVILPVREGGNRFSLESRDKFGSSASLVADVTVETTPGLNRMYGPRLVVLPTRGLAGASLWPEVFAASLQAGLLRAGRFDIVDRDSLDRVLDEHGLRGSGLVSTNAMVRVGRLLVADYVLSSRMIEREGSVTFACRAVDVGKGQVRWTAEYGLGKPNLDSIDRLARGVSLDLLRVFRLFSATVVDTTGWPESYIDAGRDKGSRTGLAVFGTVSGNTIRGTVVEVQESASKVVFGETEPVLSPGDSVVLSGIPDFTGGL